MPVAAEPDDPPDDPPDCDNPGDPPDPIGPPSDPVAAVVWAASCAELYVAVPFCRRMCGEYDEIASVDVTFVVVVASA